MQSDKNTSFQTLLRIRILKCRAKKLLKSHMFSMKAYIPLTFSNLSRVSFKDLKHYSMRDSHQRVRVLKSRARQQLLKINTFSTKAYIPVSFSNFSYVSFKDLKYYGVSTAFYHDSVNDLNLRYLADVARYFFEFFRVFHVDDVGSTRESRPQGGVAHKNDANFPSIVVIAKCRVRRLLISG